MNNQEKIKRLIQAIDEHHSLLEKELAYPEDLQNKETIARHQSNIAKVTKMLDETTGVYNEKDN